MTLYGSKEVVDPGWNLDDYIPPGTIDTGKISGRFAAASLRAVEGEKLGTFRWIVWAVAPVSEQGNGENSAFQELLVE